jgi:hypothetical protein
MVAHIAWAWSTPCSMHGACTSMDVQWGMLRPVQPVTYQRIWLATVAWQDFDREDLARGLKHF